MKLLGYGETGLEKPGILDAEGNIRDLSSLIDDIGPGFLENEGLKRLSKKTAESFPKAESSQRIGPPVTRVGKFICVGLNYAEHARESGKGVPTEPLLFMKATSAISGPFDDVVLPGNASKADWEVELGVVVGKEASHVSLDEALGFVAGVCVVNDLSERKFQLESGGQWVKGKSCDTFGPIGPYLVTLDEAGDLDNLGLWLELNGIRMQNGNTRTMVFNVPYLVHYTSQFMSLQPGDIISTGTPSGVGLGMRPQRWLKPGDVMRLGVEGLGVQQQTVVSAEV